MQFAWTQEQEDYRARIKAFVAKEIPQDWFHTIGRHGKASPEQIAFSKVFCGHMAQEGLLTNHWPVEYGGAGSDPWRQFILAEEMNLWGEPRGPQYMNVHWIGPTLIKYGTEAQRKEHLGRIATGQVIWCQGFSEPQAGTDLAALQTRAELIGDNYVINGMKIWTSYAHKAEWCFLLARTGTGRKDISIFLVPMDSPGITIQSIHGLPEEGHMHEIFFTDVVVPAGNRVGDESQAWPIITYALTRERVGNPRYHTGRMILDLAVAQLEKEGRFDDPIVRAKAGEIVAMLEAARVLTYLVVDQRANGDQQTTDPNIQRVTASEAVLELMNFLVEYTPDILTEGHPYLQIFYRANTASSIAAGTYELQLNLIAQRALELPRDH